jgi:hypothetical protein
MSLKGRFKKIMSKRKQSAFPGIATQFEGVDSSSSRKQLIVGLDFGTAFTKVVIGDEISKFAVPLRGEGKNASDYWLPTVFWSSPEGECSIDSPKGKPHDSLKMSLIEGDLSASVLIAAAAYLALVFRRVRGYIFSQKGDVYGNSRIEWLINAGLPTDSYHNDALSETYQKVIHAAWRVSSIPGAVKIDLIESVLLDEAREDDLNENVGHELHTDAISLLPEFVAQITGYVRSPLRQSDIHLLVDVGAGTLDVSVFNVHQVDGEDRFPILAKVVKPFGTRYLIQHRIDGRDISSAREFGPFANVPCKAEFADKIGLSESELQALDGPFSAKVVKAVVDLLRYTKERRYRTSRHWTNGIPIFLCGGGSRCDFYTEIFQPQDGIFYRFPLREIKLPKPGDLEAPGISRDEYDRVSVAYGLSFDPDDIGEIVRESEIEDDLPYEQEGSRECPTCRGTGGAHHPCNRCGGSGWIKAIA